jgi:hypothetical protein
VQGITMRLIGGLSTTDIIYPQQVKIDKFKEELYVLGYNAA